MRASGRAHGTPRSRLRRRETSVLSLNSGGRSPFQIPEVAGSTTCSIGCRDSSTACTRPSRSIHQSVRSASAAYRSSSSGSGMHPAHLDRPVLGHERVARDIRRQQRGGAEPAVVVELGHGCRELRAHREADARVEGARDHDRQARAGDDVERPTDAAERLRLDHEEVGGAELGDRERIVRRGARSRRPRSGCPCTSCGRRISTSSSMRRARLLDVLEVERRERVDRVLGLVDVPAAVRVDADATLGAERLAHGAHARDIRRQGARRRSRPSPSPYGIRGTGEHRARRCRGRRPARSRSPGCGRAARAAARSSRSRSPRRARRMPRRRRTRRRARTRSTPPAPRRASPRARRCRGTASRAGGRRPARWRAARCGGRAGCAASSVTLPSWHRPARGIRSAVRFGANARRMGGSQPSAASPARPDECRRAALGSYGEISASRILHSVRRGVRRDPRGAADADRVLVRLLVVGRLGGAHDRRIRHARRRGHRGAPRLGRAQRADRRDRARARRSRRSSRSRSARDLGRLDRLRGRRRVLHGRRRTRRSEVAADLHRSASRPSARE